MHDAILNDITHSTLKYASGKTNAYFEHFSLIEVSNHYHHSLALFPIIVTITYNFSMHLLALVQSNL